MYMGKRKRQRFEGPIKANDAWVGTLDTVLADAMRDAEEIRRWTDGPRPAPWRVYRLAQALRDV